MSLQRFLVRDGIINSQEKIFGVGTRLLLTDFFSQNKLVINLQIMTFGTKVMTESISYAF